MKPFVIGLCGGTGSGKTTLAKRLHEAFIDRSVLIGMDCYYKNHPELTFEERTKINYDHPDAFDTDYFISDLQALKRGEKVNVPVYDYTIHARSEEVTPVESRDVIVVEGILLFHDERVRNELDVMIFVDTDADVRILRRIIRDVKKRGRSLDSVVEQYLATVKPMHEKYIEPCKKFADIIVPEGGKNRIAFEMIRELIRERLEATEA